MPRPYLVPLACAIAALASAGAGVVASLHYYRGHPAYGWLAWLGIGGSRPGAVPDSNKDLR